MGKNNYDFSDHTFIRVTRSVGVVVWGCGNRIDNGMAAGLTSVVIKKRIF